MISSMKILTDIETLQTLPVSFAAIFDLANDEDSGIQELAEALKPDPALTSNILRLANSPFFGCRGQVASINQALMVLGSRNVVKVAVGGAFSRTIPPVLPGYLINAADFWCHCVAVAVLSERIAEHIGDPDREAAFCSGLLHDLGKLVTSTYLIDISDILLANLKGGEMPLVMVEKALLDLDHAEVGATVATTWNLPDTIGLVAGNHHTPNADRPRIVDVVHMADGLAHSLGFGSDIGELARVVDRNAQDRVGLSPADLEEITCSSIDQITDLQEIFTKPLADDIPIED